MLVNIPRPRLFGARQILAARGITEPLRAYATWDNNTQTFTSWDEGVLGTEPTVAELDAAFADVVKVRYKNILANKRYEVEVGGTTVGAYNIPTSREYQAVFNNIINYIAANPGVDVDIKRPNGNWITLTSAQATAAANGVMNHVQNCFKEEKRISNLIDAATSEADLTALDSSITNFAY